MIVGVPKEIKNEEYRVAVTPIGVKEFVRAGHNVVIQKGAGVGSGFDGRGVQGGRRQDGQGRRRVRRGRHDRQGQGAAAGRVRQVQEGPDPLHVPASCRGLRQRAHQGHDEGRHPGHRLRDRGAPERRAPAAVPDERGRRPAGHPGRRHAPAEGERRLRRAARRRDRRAAGQGRRDRRRHRRRERREDGRRHGRSHRSSMDNSASASPTSTTSSAAASRPLLSTEAPSKRRSATPTSWSAACCSPAAPRPRTWSSAPCSRT